MTSRPGAMVLSPADAAAARQLQQAVEHMRQHGLTPAIEQLAPLAGRVRHPQLRGEIHRLLGFYWLRQGQHALALQHSDAAAADLPASTDCSYNAMYACFSLGRFDETVQRGHAAIRRHGESFVWHNLMSTALGHAGRLDEGRVHGTRALQLKDALTAGVPGHDLRQVPVPPFDAGRPAAQVISFSLYGDGAKYLDGAVHNARAAPYLYPGWRCRFHVDGSVPAATLQALRAAGAEVREMPASLPAARWGTTWRFLVADDASVARYLVRDADSVLNVREAAAVQQWLASGRHFHVMRDHFDHSELVLAGMWGGVRGALPPLQPLAQAFLHQDSQAQARTADQEFLRERLWPSIRQSVLVHDSQFAFGERVDFPAHAALPPGNHVGGDWRVLLGQPAT